MSPCEAAGGLRGAKDPGDRLRVVTGFVEGGKVTPVIDRAFPLARGSGRDPLPGGRPRQGQAGHQDRLLTTWAGGACRAISTSSSGAGYPALGTPDDRSGDAGIRLDMPTLDRIQRPPADGRAYLRPSASAGLEVLVSRRTLAHLGSASVVHADEQHLGDFLHDAPLRLSDGTKAVEEQTPRRGPRDGIG